MLVPVKKASIDKALARTDLTVMTALPLISDSAEPFALFARWFDEAKAAEPALPEAMSLATATADGKPSLRMVLLKGVSAAGFVFYTNTESRKGEEIAINPAAALCFHWKSLNQQVRVEGTLTPVTSADADAYWNSRARASQISAWASAQSRPVASRAVLEARVKDYESQFAGKPVPRPPQWSGYCLAPEHIEFWQDVRDRLHERLVFHRQGQSWRTERLNP